jgi:hypothetical protein
MTSRHPRREQSCGQRCTVPGVHREGRQGQNGPTRCRTWRRHSAGTCPLAEPASSGSGAAETRHCRRSRADLSVRLALGPNQRESEVILYDVRPHAGEPARWLIGAIRCLLIPSVSAATR